MNTTQAVTETNTEFVTAELLVITKDRHFFQDECHITGSTYNLGVLVNVRTASKEV